MEGCSWTWYPSTYEIEEYILNNARPKETKAIHGINWLEKFLDNEKHTVYTEKIIYSEELRLAGSVDLIIKNKLTNEYTIIDWKTNEKIPTTSYNKKMGTHLITSDIEDCKYSVYSLQLSLYRYILEKYYGLKVKQQIIAHVNDYTVDSYLPPYHKGHMDAITELRKENN